MPGSSPRSTPFAPARGAAWSTRSSIPSARKSTPSWSGPRTTPASPGPAAARRCQLNGDAVEAKLFVALWDLYAKSAVDDPSKFGGPWGFDSDFVSMEVVAGWRIVENDPSLTDADRLRRGPAPRGRGAAA